MGKSSGGSTSHGVEPSSVVGDTSPSEAEVQKLQKIEAAQGGQGLVGLGVEGLPAHSPQASTSHASRHEIRCAHDQLLAHSVSAHGQHFVCHSS